MRSPSSGFTMIEVLVALLVLGSGALAMLMLQLHALRSQRDAALQAGAAAMAMELAELRAAYLAAAPEGADPHLFVFDSRNAAASPPADDCSAGCSADAFARAAVAQWRARLADTLPGARAVVCRDDRADAGDDWRCDDDPAAAVVVKLGWRNGADAARAADAGPLLALPIGR